MTRFPSLLLALIASPSAALTPALVAPESGTWECVDALGSPLFAFSILDQSRYADPSGPVANYIVTGWGLIEFTGGIWAGTGGSFVPGILALMLPGAADPVICLHRPQ